MTDRPVPRIPRWFRSRRGGRVLAVLALSAVLAGGGSVSLLRIWRGDAGAGAVPAPFGAITWRAGVPGFGGMSALAVTDAGTRMIAIGDRGTIWRADLSRDAAGRLTGIALRSHARLRARKGGWLSPFARDAESIALDPDWQGGGQGGGQGGFHLGFESYVRVLHYAGPEAVPTNTDAWNRFEPRFGNLGFEALAPLPGGGILAIAEAGLPDLDPPGSTPAFRHDGSPEGRWQPAFSLPDTGPYGVSGADLGPDGRLYVLERRLDRLRGFAVRIRRFTLDGAGETLRPGPAETLLETRPGVLGNMEGISLWQTAAGETILSLISDDNFLPLLGTGIVEYRLADLEQARERIRERIREPSGALPEDAR